MKIRFDQLSYQQQAIEAVTKVFRGQEICQSNFTVYAPAPVAGQQQLLSEGLGHGNKLMLTEGQLLENIREVQLEHGLPLSAEGDVGKKTLDLGIEMETGTGKTYVYLRTIMELHAQYGFKKFIIVVPSIPIKEGVYKSLQMTEEHLRAHYDQVPYTYFVYNSDRLSEVRSFAVDDRLQIMVINIDAFKKSFEREDDERLKANIIHRYNDKLGYKPLDLIRETHPVVIVDEPQTTLSTDLAKKAVQQLQPMAILRYSATHKEKHNMLYKLDAVDAYQQKLVKQIEVASVQLQDEASQGAFIRLEAVQAKGGSIAAKLLLDVRAKSGHVQRKVKTVRQNDDLHQLTGLQAYQDWWVQEIYAEKGQEYVLFGNDTLLRVGEGVGGGDEQLLRRMMIRKTIAEHLDKELRLNPQGIKVLSLFFIDSVRHYREYDEEGNARPGDYARMFEEEYAKLLALPKYHTLFEGVHDRATLPQEVHNGYFSVDKRAKASDSKQKFECYKDTNGKTTADEDTYQLIMRDKERLLSFDSKLRFIFSHSALKEGWDNPNVFQICTLKEAGASEIRRRQEIGRGLRLCVDQEGKRVYGFKVNTLTVVASESYEDFVENFQRELTEDTGIEFGVVQPDSFSQVVIEQDYEKGPVLLGHEASRRIYEHCQLHGYIDKKGKVQDGLRLALREEIVSLPPMSEHVKQAVLRILHGLAGKLDIKPAEERKTIAPRKEVLLSADFKALWERIRYKTTYMVKLDSGKLIAQCQKDIREQLLVSRGKVLYTKAGVQIDKSGVQVGETEEQYTQISQPVDRLPDIVTYLQETTQLTRRSIVEILQGCGKLELFKRNPQKFIEGCIDIIRRRMQQQLVDGIVYKRIGEGAYYCQELFEQEELTGYLTRNMQESSKSPYTHVVYDSEVERKLVEEFERSREVKLYAKLPGWFKIDTPLGSYNPDWAVLLEQEGQERLYFVLESKGSLSELDLRPVEQAKISCGQKHFAALAEASGQPTPLLKVTKLKDLLQHAECL